ncbi:MAG: ABC-type Na+ efflux pump permease subunit [Glaciecola sp.]|jgi:ABC-type Na+ efflux pump permease subunit
MKRILIFLIAISIIGCNYVDKPIKPENLISEDKMVDVLYDVFILTSAKGTSKGILEANGIYPENYVFEKHKIDSLQFALSNEYYGFRVEEYESIIARVEERFNADRLKVQAKIDKEAADKQRKKDSIRKLSDALKVNKSRKFQEPRK